MPPAVRRASLEDAVAGFAGQSDVVLAWATTADPAAPSALPGWTAGDVLWHLALSAEALRVAASQRAAGKPIEISDLVAGYPSAAGEVFAQAKQQSGDAAQALRSRTAQALAAIPGAGAVVPLFGDAMRLADAIVTRTVELVVHGLDLGIEPDRAALGVTVRALTGIFATRHPGRAVELRVAPYAAVQVLEGTTHRRGTPTAVVSCDPLPWVRLATGRLSWAAAEAEGSLTARGERSDLSAYLPLLS